MLERLRQSGWSIQAQLLLYSSALLIPALIFSGLMILRSASLERTAMEDEITDVVRSLATAIDRELSATTTTLKALASSPALTEGDLKAFYNPSAPPGRATVTSRSASPRRIAPTAVAQRVLRWMRSKFCRQGPPTFQTCTRHQSSMARHPIARPLSTSAFR